MEIVWNRWEYDVFCFEVNLPGNFGIYHVSATLHLSGGVESV